MIDYEVLASVDTASAARELASAPPPMWDEFAARSTYPGSVHSDTRSILLRGPFSLSRAYAPRAPRVIRHELPATQALVNSVLARLPVATVGNVLIAELKPFGQVDPHIDQGPYAEHYERFHIAVAGECVFYVNDRPHYPKVGDVFQFNHRAMHHVSNPFTEARVHVIVDITLKE